jgi:hypothetical protein
MPIFRILSIRRHTRLANVAITFKTKTAWEEDKRRSGFPNGDQCAAIRTEKISVVKGIWRPGFHEKQSRGRLLLQGSTLAYPRARDEISGPHRISAQ